MPLFAAYNFETLTVDSAGSNTLTNTNTIAQANGLDGKAMVGKSLGSMNKTTAMSYVPNRSSTFTHSTWFRLTSTAVALCYVIMWRTPTFQTCFLCQDITTTPVISGHRAAGSGLSQVTYYAGKNTSIGPWNHVASGHNGTGAYWCMINGSLTDDYSSAVDTADYSQSAQLTLGNYNTNFSGRQVPGLVDTVKMDDTQWSKAQMKNEYARGMGFF